MAANSISLEVFAEEDIPQLIRWIPSQEFLLQWAGCEFAFPLTEEQLLSHIAKGQAESPAHLLKAIDRVTGQHVGHIEIGCVDQRNRAARLMRVLVWPPELRGKGIGKVIVRKALRIAFQDLGLHRLERSVCDFNTQAIRCYSELGFQFEGTRRESVLHGGEFWNISLMGILRKKWHT